MTVLERVLVLDRRVRLTPLAMLELLATERIEGGRWASRSAMTGNGEDIPLTLTARAWNCKFIYLFNSTFGPELATAHRHSSLPPHSSHVWPAILL